MKSTDEEKAKITSLLSEIEEEILSFIHNLKLDDIDNISTVLESKDKFKKVVKKISEEVLYPTVGITATIIPALIEYVESSETEEQRIKKIKERLKTLVSFWSVLGRKK